METNQKNNQTEESTEIIERFTVYPVLWLAAFYSLIIYLITIFPLFIQTKLYLFTFLSFFSSFIFTYILLFLLVFILLAVLYRHKAHNSKFFASTKFLGFYPVLVLSRTGISKIDFVGLIISLGFAVVTIFVVKIQFLFPFFFFLALLFIFSLLFGRTKSWN